LFQSLADAHDTTGASQKRPGFFVGRWPSRTTFLAVGTIEPAAVREGFIVACAGMRRRIDLSLPPLSPTRQKAFH
jgi:hypothetical protein